MEGGVELEPGVLIGVAQAPASSSSGRCHNCRNNRRPAAFEWCPLRLHPFCDECGKKLHKTNAAAPQCIVCAGECCCKSGIARKKVVGDEASASDDSDAFVHDVRCDNGGECRFGTNNARHCSTWRNSVQKVAAHAREKKMVAAIQAVLDNTNATANTATVCKRTMPVYIVCAITTALPLLIYVCEHVRANICVFCTA